MTGQELINWIEENNMQNATIELHANFRVSEHEDDAYASTEEFTIECDGANCISFEAGRNLMPD